MEALSDFLLALSEVEQAAFVGAIVALLMFLTRLVWKGAFASSEEAAKFKRTLAAAVVALVVTAMAASAEGWENYTAVGFLLAWAMGWAGSQGAHIAGKRLRGV